MAPRLRVGFQGEHGAYSEQAAMALYGPEADAIPCETFDAVFDGVEQGMLDYGVVPIENSLAGSIHRNYELLFQQPLHLAVYNCASRTASSPTRSKRATSAASIHTRRRWRNANIRCKGWAMCK
jgi:hypothetical protein